MSNYLNWLNKHGWEYKGPSSSGEVQIKTCPFCNDMDSHFYFNINSGLYHCKVATCHSSGNFFMLLKQTGDLRETALTSSSSKLDVEESKLDIYYNNLLADESVMQYLKKRKISKDAIDYFRLGITEGNNNKVLVIPYFENDKLVNIHYRSLDKKGYWWEPRAKLVLFNNVILQDKLSQVIVTEGELDAMSIWSQGIHDVISVPSGAGTFKAEWVEELDKVDMVFICYDNDRAGIEGSNLVAERFDYKKEKIFYVQLPPKIKDSNQFFIEGGTRKQFEEILKRAKPFEVKSIVSYENAITEWKERLLYGIAGMGLKTPWHNFNERLNEGFMEGDLSILSGLPGTGKTTFYLNWAWWLASEQQTPTLFYCLEMSDTRLLPRLGNHILQKDTLNNIDIEALADLNVPLYFVRDYDFRHKGNYFLDLIRMAVKRYGIKVVFFDNIQFAINDIENITAQTSALTKNFKLLAEELKIPIFVVHHLTKVEDERKAPSSRHLRDSGMARANADFILILHRNRIQDEEDMLGGDIYERNGVLVIDKARYSESGLVHLNYNGKLATWQEASSMYQFDLVGEE